MKKQPIISADEISREILLAINNISDAPDIAERGIVMSMSDGIAWVWGLKSCGFHEIIEIDTDTGEVMQAFALNLEEDKIGAVVLGEEVHIKAGARARTTGKIFSVPVGEGLVGRIIDPLGRPLDNLGPIETLEVRPVEAIAPG
ncbi:MAG: F0F1 ATP synthase subunit alpha, partial [Patescibacteria group bacterium]